LSKPKILKQIEGSYLNTVSLTYPSDYYIENDSPEVKKFNRDFKTKNNYIPGMFSYRGFDVTFEILSALAKNENLEDGILHASRRGIQGKFEFVRKPFGGYFNNGVFMVQYKDWRLEDVSN
jgi:hypothetical protein